MKSNVAKCILVAGLVSVSCAHQDSFASSTRRESSGESSARGASLFRKSCAVCHGIQPGETKVGPSLYGVLREGSGHSEEAVRQVIANGKGTMPAFKEKLEPLEIDDLLEYLRIL